MNRSPFPFRHTPLIALAIPLLLASTVLAQAKPKKKDPALEPRPVALKTKDGVTLSSYYFPSDKGKEAVPVLIIHEWKGQAGPYVKLCLALRDAGYAVLALEYRGHGKSRTYTDRAGKEQEFNIATMGKRDVESIISFDLEEAKQFLKKENNEGRLNLNALALVGVQQGSIIAAHWAVRDWNFPSVGQKKQGQDVKALVYISPEKNHAGIAIDTTLTNPNTIRLPIMIVAGKQSPQAAEAERLGKRIEVMRKRANQGSVEGFKLDLKETPLVGPILLNEVSDVIPSVVEFLGSNIPISDSENPWIERK